MIAYERRYTQQGRMAHLLDPVDLARNGATPTALCERWQWSASGWWGSGSQDEIERAAVLPLCTGCGRVSAASGQP